jgi:hypothetical protein
MLTLEKRLHRSNALAGGASGRRIATQARVAHRDAEPIAIAVGPRQASTAIWPRPPDRCACRWPGALDAAVTSSTCPGTSWTPSGEKLPAPGVEVCPRCVMYRMMLIGRVAS